MASNGLINGLLGYPAYARLLIVNADDFGICHAVNAAIMDALGAGIVRSTSLMVPCPWALHAVHPGLDTPELLVIEPGNNRNHQADFDFLTSQQAHDIVREEGIVLLDYRALQVVWQEKAVLQAALV